MNLLVKPKKNSQEIVSVTPRSAGWRYVSFSAHQLTSGESLTLFDDGNELCAVILTGKVSAKTGALEWKEIGGRESVFEDAAPYAVYVPPRTKLTITANTGAELAVARSLQRVNFPPGSSSPPPCAAALAEKAPILATSAISCPRINLLSPSSWSKLRRQAETHQAIPRTNTTWTTFPQRVCSRKPTTIASTHRRALFSNASTATRAKSMSQWRSKIAMSSSYLVATIRWSFLTATSPITSTLWQVPNASGTFTTTRLTSGFYQPLDRITGYKHKSIIGYIQNPRLNK